MGCNSSNFEKTIILFLFSVLLGNTWHFFVGIVSSLSHSFKFVSLKVLELLIKNRLKELLQKEISFESFP